MIRYLTDESVESIDISIYEISVGQYDHTLATQTLATLNKARIEKEVTQKEPHTDRNKD